MSIMQYIDLLPASIVELIDIIGPDAAETIVKERGGVSLSIPVKAQPTHWLSAAIGADAFQTLVHHYQGEEIWIPRCQAAFQQLRKQQIIDGKANGKTTVELALQHKVTDRYVRSVLAEARNAEPDAQIDLFNQPERP